VPWIEIYNPTVLKIPGVPSVAENKPKTGENNFISFSPGAVLEGYNIKNIHEKITVEAFSDQKLVNGSSWSIKIVAHQTEGFICFGIYPKSILNKIM